MGQKYASFDAQGAITAFYDSVDSPVPHGAAVIEITDDEWQRCLATPGYAVTNGALSAPSAAFLLTQAQSSQVDVLAQAYAAAIAQPVSYTTKAGVAKTYQADPGSVSNLQNTLLGLQAAQATPTGFYWVAADNTQVPFTYADLQALAAAMLAQGWAAFQKLQTLKAQVAAATTVTAVQAVTWA